MHDQIQNIRTAFDLDLKQVGYLKDVEALHVKYLGRKGPVQELMKQLREAPPEVRAELGKTINTLKVDLEHHLAMLKQARGKQELEEQLAKESVDVTQPGRPHRAGHIHPVMAMTEELCDILVSMGFSIQYGPEIESDYYNFGALNFPPNHPARDEHDTYYIADDVLLRTHTTPIQARVMEHHTPPIRIATPGRCFRNEDITARSHVVFHQNDGLYIDKGVTMGDLMATLQEFLDKLFHKKAKLRFRASYFPFVEPGMEVDIACTVCDGHGCRLCKDSGWLEVLGAGMVHPEVLLAGGIDPEVYSGYAWGMGIERLVMLRHGLSDIRLFTDNDLRFLHQFRYA